MKPIIIALIAIILAHYTLQQEHKISNLQYNKYNLTSRK